MRTIYKKLLFLLLFLPLGVLAQSTLSGTVTEKASGQPLPGVNIVVQGSTSGVSTDFDGNFTISGINSGDILVFSYVGFQTTTVTYTGQRSIAVSMEEDANQLQEVVVQVGYGTVKRREATVSLTNLTAEEFNKGPLVSVDQLLQGRVAGLQITNGGGEPGGGATVRIRSGSSLSANNDPLYVIDGVLLDAGGGGIQGGRNPLATINQNDIASMTVLKDAAATAIYGSRASNGVIIITTKKGQSGEMRISYDGNFQVNEITDFIDVLNGEQYGNYVTEFGTPAQVGLLGMINIGTEDNPTMVFRNTNWQKEIYRTALGTDHNVALSGGSENIVYRTSLGYTNINGLLKHDNYERTTLAANVTGNFFDNHLKVEINNKTATTKNNYSNRDAVGAAVSYDPTQPIRQPIPLLADGTPAPLPYDFGGYFQWTSPTNGNYEVNSGVNPVSLLEQRHNFGTSVRSIGNIQFDYKLHFFEDLKLIANLGYDYNTGVSFGNTDEAYPVAGQAGSEYRNSSFNKNQLMDLYFNYNKDISSINTTFDVTAGYNYQDFKYENTGYSYDAVNDLFIPGNLDKTRLNLQSFFGRANISIADKYMIYASFRADGSSRFTEENRWGYFPSVAGAWRIGEESFVKGGKVVSDLKLRASWGLTGQQDIGIRYPAVALYSQSTGTAMYQFGYDQNGDPVYYNTLTPLSYNTDLKWEETETLNLGLDFGFFNDRITGAVDVYRRTTENLLAFVPNPQGVNFSNAANYNIGELENEGVEVNFDTYPVRNDNWTWRIGFNTTFQKSKITKLTNSTAGYVAGPGISGGTGTTIQNNQVGFAPNSFFVFEQAYDAEGQAIDGVYVDRNLDGVINADDMYRFKKPAADVFYGFNTDVTYKNWWLSMSFHGMTGNYNYNNVYSNLGNQSGALPSNGNYLNNAHTSILANNFASPRFLSDLYVQEASFLRMDNVTIGHTFKNVFREDGSDLRLTGSVQNVFVITGYKGVDPEFSNGVDNNLYPRPRTFTLGLNINF
ncbi:MAG: TonB-dependent receptor [Flavobacterium sp.]|nr:TonB-dependent receptor [Flavobacterium sp.]